jgi:stage V sporulation protein B
MEMSGIKRFFASAFLLTVSALIMRSISVSFSAYVSNTAGAEAMGVFSQIMSVFGFALTIATSGVNLAVTRMVSEALAQNDDGLVRKSMKKSIAYCLFFSILSGSLLFIFSEPIGAKVLKDERTIFSLKILSLSLPFISLTSALGGYFTAVRRVYKSTAYSVAEQLIKIFFTVKMFELYIHRGIEYACIALVSADAISEFSAFAMSASMYLLDRKKHIKRKATAVSDSVVSKKLCKIALPIAASTYIRSGLITIEHILIPKSLIKSGLSRSAALASYGMLHSMVMPVVLFPTAVLSSFSGLLVPELAEAAVKGKKGAVQNIAERAFQYSLLFSFCISGILICFSGEFGIIIYDSLEASRFIKIMAPLVPVMYLDSVTDAMLKGLDKQIYSMNVNIIDALLSIILVAVLLPKYGIMGYVMTIYATELVNASLSIAKLIEVSEMRAKIFKWAFSPLISVIGATTLGRIIFSAFELPLGMISELVLNCVMVVLLYCLLIQITGAFTKRDKVWLKNAIGIRQFSADRCGTRQDARKHSAPLQKEPLKNIQKY